MAFLSMGRRKSLVGLDLGSHAAKVLQLKKTKEGFTIQSIGMAQYPVGSFEGPHIADLKAVGRTVGKLWENLKLKEKSVVVAIPGNEIMTEMPTIPSMKRSAVFPYVDTHIKEFIMYAPDEVFYGIDVLSENQQDGTLTVLIAYARRGVMYDYEKLISLAGLDLIVADVDYFALFNAFEATEGFSEEVVALVDIGASKTISVIVDDKLPVFTKSFLLGSNELVFQIVDKFNLSIEDAYKFVSGAVDPSGLQVSETEVKALLLFFVDQVVAEIRNILDYFSGVHRGGKVRQLFLSGGIARSPGVAFQIERSLGMPVFVFNPLANDKVKVESYIDLDYVKTIGPQMAVCFGLALRQEEDRRK